MGFALKGQMLSTEILLALSIFLVSMGVFMLSWNAISSSYQQQQADSQMESALLSVSDTLVLSPGNPSDWETSALSNASLIGIASARNVLSPAKAAALQSLNSTSYDAARGRLGAGRFDLFIAITGQSGATLYSFGREANPGNESISAISTQRMALMNGSIVSLKVQLWRNKGRVI